MSYVFKSGLVSSSVTLVLCVFHTSPKNELCLSLSVPQCRMVCKDVSAETMYDVLHDIEYRRKWDTNVLETFDIGKLTVNADVGYYSCMLRTHIQTCKHLHSFVTNIICEGTPRNT